MNENTEKLISIHASFVAEQSKYVYFILTFSVSAIGFWIHMTANLHLSIAELNWKYYFLFGCVFFWISSILLGMKSRKYILLSAQSNMDALLINDEKMSLDKKTLYYEQRMKTMKNNSKKAESYFELQATSFIIGTFIFSVWHILQIFSN